jgi:hypothetical protein
MGAAEARTASAPKLSSAQFSRDAERVQLTPFVLFSLSLSHSLSFYLSLSWRHGVLVNEREREMKPPQEPAADMEQEDTLRDFVPPLRSKLGELRPPPKAKCVALHSPISALSAPCLLCSSPLLFSLWPLCWSLITHARRLLMHL